MNSNVAELIREQFKTLDKLFPEEFQDVVERMVSGYRGNLWHDKLFITWTIADVKADCGAISDEHAREILEYAGHNHDANWGISWQTFSDIKLTLSLSERLIQDPINEENTNKTQEPSKDDIDD